MAWVINTSEINPPFNVAGSLSGYGFPDNDYDKGAEVAGIFKTGGRQLDRDESPTELDLHDPKAAEKLPGLFCTENGALIACSEIRKSIELVEPELHQFVPLTLTCQSKALDAEGWSLMNAHRRIRSIDLEKSAIKESRGFDRKVRLKLDFHKEQVVLIDSLVENLHIWRDSQFPQALFCSDSLFEKIGHLLKATHHFKTCV